MRGFTGSVSPCEVSMRNLNIRLFVVVGEVELECAYQAFLRGGGPEKPDTQVRVRVYSNTADVDLHSIFFLFTVTPSGGTKQ